MRIWIHRAFAMILVMALLLPGSAAAATEEIQQETAPAVTEPAPTEAVPEETEPPRYTVNTESEIYRVCEETAAEMTYDQLLVYDATTDEILYMDTREGRFLPVPHCIRGTQGWTLHPDIAKTCARGMLSFEKPTFGSTALMHHVANAAAEKGCVNGKGMTVELCGVCTDICVVSNALLIKAALPEMELVVDSALCAGVTPQKHEAALETMRSCQIVVK